MHTRQCTHANAHTPMHTRQCTHTNTYTQTHTHKHRPMHTRTHTNTPTPMHTNTHRPTRTCRPMKPRDRSWNTETHTPTPMHTHTVQHNTHVSSDETARPQLEHRIQQQVKAAAQTAGSSGRGCCYWGGMTVGGCSSRGSIQPPTTATPTRCALCGGECGGSCACEYVCACVCIYTLYICA